ncbi:LLM class flavin-dependent oxidoreductase [Streptomyces sp. NPDC048504]|uniref:LLM class flavin-dependent oxidoreductase n=1 Tax=Streptomyces sp. NPDC048504 TaxID=3365559 RepID=UPI00371AD045
MSVHRDSDTDEGPLRIGVRVPPCDRADRVARTGRRAEELGFDQVWFPDSQLLWRDVFTTLTAAAFATEYIGLGTAVTNLATRHPSVVASAARSVAELAPGRFTLGLGVGNSSVVGDRSLRVRDDDGVGHREGAGTVDEAGVRAAGEPDDAGQGRRGGRGGVVGGSAGGALTLEIERRGIDAFAEAVERQRSGEAIGKVVLDLG